MRAGWADVRVEHVESHGVGDTPEVGSTLTVRVFVSLGSLTPDDVDVEVVHGVIDGDDELVDTQVTRLTLADELRRRPLPLRRRGPARRGGAFGYTVRIVPRHSVLASVSELGLVALPSAGFAPSRHEPTRHRDDPGPSLGRQPRSSSRITTTVRASRTQRATLLDRREPARVVGAGRARPPRRCRPSRRAAW